MYLAKVFYMRLAIALAKMLMIMKEFVLQFESANVLEVQKRMRHISRVAITIMIPFHPGQVLFYLVPLVPIAGTTKLVPYHLIKSLQLIWRRGTSRFYLLVPHLQVSYSDLTGMIRFRIDSSSNGLQSDHLTHFINIRFLLQPVAGEDVLGNNLHMPKYFRLEQLQEEFDFATEEELAASRRFKLLQLREQEVQDFRNYKMVPAFDKEVPDLVFEVIPDIVLSSHNMILLSV